MPIDSNDLAWAAGIFEGEGSIRISPATRRNLGHLTATIANTDYEMLEWFNARWPGYFKVSSNVGTNWRPAWWWMIAAKKAAVFLRAIQPYVKTRRVQMKIELGLRFQDNKRVGHPRSPEYATRQRAFFLEMKALNVRGRSALDRIADANKF
jgi:hypothetical protein